jgi:homoserine dehydrogenase
MRQYDHEGDNAPVLIVTHATSQSALATALADLKSHDPVIGTPVALRIEQI